MSAYTPLPRFVHHNSTRLTHVEAHALLSSFLERANNDAAYRPDSTLTERGPQSTSTATKSDLTLHHLNRIKQGLEGKSLGVKDLENGFLSSATARKRKRGEDGEATPTSSIPGTPATTRQSKPHSTRVARQVTTGVNEDPTAAGPAVTAAQLSENEWQDKDDYELAQADDDIDLHNGQRDAGAGLAQPGNSEEEEELVEIEVEGTGERIDPRMERTGKGTPKRADKSSGELGDEPKSGLSKEERKRRKKERAAEEKRQREANKVKKA